MPSNFGNSIMTGGMSPSSQDEDAQKAQAAKLAAIDHIRQMQGVAQYYQPQSGDINAKPQQPIQIVGNPSVSDSDPDAYERSLKALAAMPTPPTLEHVPDEQDSQSEDPEDTKKALLNLASQYRNK